MIDIQKMKQAALAANKPESFTVDEVIEFTDLSMPSAVLALIERLEAAESNIQLATAMYTQAISKLEAAERDAARWKAFVAEAERDYVEVSTSEEPYYQRFECAAAMEEFADAAMKESK